MIGAGGESRRLLLARRGYELCAGTLDCPAPAKGCFCPQLSAGPLLGAVGPQDKTAGNYAPVTREIALPPLDNPLV
jgi:hypothetical protein